MACYKSRRRTEKHSVLRRIFARFSLAGKHQVVRKIVTLRLRVHKPSDKRNLKRIYEVGNRREPEFLLEFKEIFVESLAIPFVALDLQIENPGPARVFFLGFPYISECFVNR